MSSTITIGSNSYTLCTIPTSPGAAEIELGMNDAVTVFTSPFTGTQQTQLFPGGDSWDATITLPPMTRQEAAPWEGFLAELRGKANVFQLGDLRYASPLGAGWGFPITSGTNLAMTTSLTTSGWMPHSATVLKTNDMFSLGYRLYKVCEDAVSDSSGAATLNIWPSLREAPAAGVSLVIASPKGLFRLKDNRRAIHWSPSRLTTISISCVEAR